MKKQRIIAVITVFVYLNTIVFGFCGCNNSKVEIPIETPSSVPLEDNTQECLEKEISPTSYVNESTGTDVSPTPSENNDDIEKDNTKTVFNPVFVDSSDYKFEDIECNIGDYDAKVVDYSINSDLSNVENLEQFGSFTDEQKEKISKNGFVVMPTDNEQLFHIYERNEYLKIPSFITTDSLLQVYHVFFDYSLRTLELLVLLEKLEILTDSMLNKSIYLYNNIDNEEIKNYQLKNIAYFAVAQMALEKDMPENIPEEAKKLAGEEYKKVKGQAGFLKSSIYDFDLDFSQYKPRGHYTRNHDFERYFVAMMWYGQVPFSLYDTEGNRNIKDTVKALLITYTAFLQDENCEETDVSLWESIYNPTTFYVGKADDLTIYDYKDLIINIFSSTPDINRFIDQENLDEFYLQAENLRNPEINAELTTVNSPSGKQFRFMGQRYIPDSEIMQALVHPIKRSFPKGLDVMAVLESSRAYDILVNDYKVLEQWPEYLENFNGIKEKFSKLSNEKWRSNMYYGWFWVLKTIIKPFGEGYPLFMKNNAWLDKSLNTALGSWAELRHDTILYGKQCGAEGGGDWPPPEIKGYVEPNVEFYEKLLWLTKYSRINLDEKNVLPNYLKNRMQDFEDLLEFLILCSIKELRNEELTKEEYYKLLIYGGVLEEMTLSMATGPILSDTDRNMAVIADVHTTPGEYLEEAVGTASQMFVVVPIGGKLYLTRGAVFSYYEFVSNKRLTDEEWQKMIKENAQWEQPKWTDSYNEGIKDEIPIPEKPYQY